MLRLGINSGEVLWHEVALRLRGAMLESQPELGSRAANDDDGAVILVGDVPNEAETVERFLKAGQHVLRIVETPLPTHACEHLQKVAAENGNQLCLVNPDRFLPSRQLIRSQLDAGKLGEPGLVRLLRWKSATASCVSGERDLSVALLRDIDLTLWLMGRSPNVVFATQPTDESSSTHSGPCVHLHLGFDGGGMALIDFSDRMTLGEEYDSLSVIGSAGAAYADDHQNRQLLFQGGKALTLRTDEGVRQYVALVQDFVDALATNRDLSSSISEWQCVLSVAGAVRESLATRQAVRKEGC